MSAATYEFHSPLTLLRQWRDCGSPLRELLITGYTLDLAFFERYCASIARALGARVTVLADAGQATHEAVDVRYAGRSYQHGHATCGGAFHPKLAILVGDEDAWVAIGSGNPTVSGWGYNHELWLVLRTSRAHGPAILHDLGAWLADLPNVVTMPSWIGDTIVHVGKLITPAELDDSLPRLQVFGNLRRTLVSQLPSTKARTLRLTAPFIDDRAAAVRSLIHRFSPDELAIALQSNLAQFNGQELTRATTAVPHTHLRILDEERTSHGKLVEWSTEDSTTALIGSANITAAALLTTTDNGGNCELVASYPVTSSLLPDGDPADHASIQAITTSQAPSAEQRRPSVTLLGARVLRETVIVELTTNTTKSITIETSPDGTPGTWSAIHLVRPMSSGDRLTEQFRAPEILGNAVRATVPIDGGKLISSVVFLTDTARCLPREETADRPSLHRDYAFDEIINDQVLSHRFQADLLRLLHQTQPADRSSGTQSAADAQAAVSDDKFGAWLETVERSIGPSLAGLILPGAATTAQNQPTGSWSVARQADTAELAEDEDEQLLDHLHVQATEVSISPSQRQKWRQWARRLRRAVSVEPPPPLELRMVVARIHLDLLAAGVWETDDAWRTELRDVTQALAITPDEDRHAPGDALSYTSSLIAVCLALLGQETTPGSGDETDLIARAAWRSVGEWAAYAELELVRGYLYPPEQPYARVAAESEAEAIIALAAEGDPRAELQAVLEAHDLPATWMEGVWVADGTFRNPRRIAAHVATLVGSPCVVLARNGHKTTLVLRQRATLAIAESTVPRWRLYHLSPVSTPLSILGDGDAFPSTRNTTPLEPVPQQIRAIVDTAGANLQHLLATLRVG